MGGFCIYWEMSTACLLDTWRALIESKLNAIAYLRVPFTSGIYSFRRGFCIHSFAPYTCSHLNASAGRTCGTHRAFSFSSTVVWLTPFPRFEGSSCNGIATVAFAFVVVSWVGVGYYSLANILFNACLGTLLLRGRIGVQLSSFFCSAVAYMLFSPLLLILRNISILTKAAKEGILPNASHMLLHMRANYIPGDPLTLHDIEVTSPRPWERATWSFNTTRSILLVNS
jgi:hypothetical protein